MDNEAPIINVDKIVEKSKQWTLEGDCILLQWMDQISKNLEERSTKTSCALNNLSTNLDRTSVALSNATNNLAALQYSQFVENRVHDDDETLANISEVPNTDSDVTDKASTNNIVSFLKKNLEMMNSCHEAYSISYDDSDDDEPATNVIYRSKNPYETRPLPHIYGTNLWKEKWHIGLCDSDNDFSGDENSEQFSESSSTAEDSYESTAPTMSEWDSTAWGLNTNHLVGRKDIPTPLNDGESTNQGENNSPSGVSPSSTQKNLSIIQPIEEQRYYQHVPKKEDNLFDDIFASSEQQAAPQSIAPLSKKISQEPLIDDEPPLDTQAVESDNNRRIGAKKPLNLFDDDEFSSFMDQIVQTATNKSTKTTNSQDGKQETPKKSTIPNLFDDSDDMFAPKVAKPLQETKRSIPTNLFDDSEDIFSPNVKGSTEEKMAAPKRTVVPNLFDDSDDIFTPQVTLEENKEPLKKVVPNIFHDSEDPFASNAIETNNDDKQDISSKLEDDTFSPPSVSRLVDKIRTTNLFDDEEDDDFESIFAAKPKSSKSFAEKTKNLFSDDLDDTPTVSRNEDIIPERGAVHEDVKYPSVKESTTKEVSFLSRTLFDNDEDTLQKEEDIFAKKPSKKDLFEEDKEENESLNQISSSKDQTRKQEEFAEEINKNEPSKSNVVSALKNDLFSDVFRDEPPPDDDIFAPSVGKKNSKIADIFADDFTDDFEEFIPKPSPSKLVEEVSQKKKPLDSEGSATLDKISEIIPKPDAEEKDLEPVRISNSTETEVGEAETLSKEPSISVKNREQSGESNMSTLSAVFENEDLSTEDPQKVESPEDHLEEKKPPAVPTYTALFDDEPPPDDDVPHGSTFEEMESEPPKYNVDEDDVANNPNAPSYGGINLFTDVPPDDDFPASPPSETKRIHSIFYDDFPETIEATRDMRAPSSYIFNDEPPPDDDLQSPKVVSEEKYVKPAEEQKPKPKVSKLKKIDLQINVAALLPSAKVPSFKKSEPVEPVSEPASSSELDSETIGSSDKDTPTPRTIQPKRDLPENILPNLNRDRAKVQVKRRPSTRKGRQESYRKSIIDDEKLATEQKRQEEVRVVEENPKKATSLFEDFGTFDSRSVNAAKPALGEDASKEEFKTNTTVKKVSEQVQIFKGTIPVVNASTKKIPSLFDDSDTEAGNTTTKPTPQEVTTATTSKRLDSLFGSDDEDANTLSTKALKKSIKSKGTSEITPQTTSTQSNPKLAYPVKEKKSLPPLVKPLTEPSSLFSESDDDYDLFKEEAVSNKPTPQKPFETKLKQQKPVSKPTKAAPSTLFSSEEDNGSGDDIFGKSKTKLIPKKVESTKVKPSSNLFSDLTDDDDDDLFGTAKKKPDAVEKSKAKPLPTTATTINLEPSKSSPLTPQQQTATTSNPLADLLDS